jgi:hypothetical protein
LADAAFFVDAARPVTQMRLRWDTGWDMTHPDRAEYFWAREGVTTANAGGGGKGPNFVPGHLDYKTLSMYMEGAAGGFGMFVETPYLDIEPVSGIQPGNPPVAAGSNKSGFGDIMVGTKSLLLDCQLIQIAIEFKTYIPSGNFTTGLGTGHVSLEPSILLGLCLTPNSYLQGQFSYWIPISGDNLYQGNIFHCHLSYNHVLWRFCPEVLLVGTAECNEWSIINGNYTTLEGNTAVAVSARDTIFSVGPGVRLFVCDKIDLGVGSAFSLTSERWASELVRAEFRWRF